VLLASEGGVLFTFIVSASVFSKFIQIYLEIGAEIPQSVLRRGYVLDDWGSIPNGGNDRFFLFATASKQDLGPTQPPIQCVPGVKLLGREGDHSPPYSAEVKNSWRSA